MGAGGTKRGEVQGGRMKQNEGSRQKEQLARDVRGGLVGSQPDPGTSVRVIPTA